MPSLHPLHHLKISVAELISDELKRTHRLAILAGQPSHRVRVPAIVSSIADTNVPRIYDDEVAGQVHRLQRVNQMLAGRGRRGGEENAVECFILVTQRHAGETRVEVI